MELTMQALTGLPDGDDLTWLDDAISAADPDKRALGVIATRAEGTGLGHLVLLLPDGTDAADRRYAVTARGLVADPPAARHAQFTEFFGRTPEWLAANERAGRERIWPAVRTVPGTVGVLHGAGDGDVVVVSLAESREAIGAAARAIMSTELLPWERPEHLTGPDRMTIERVVHVVLPDDGWDLG